MICLEKSTAQIILRYYKIFYVITFMKKSSCKKVPAAGTRQSRAGRGRTGRREGRSGPGSQASMPDPAPGTQSRPDP